VVLDRKWAILAGIAGFIIGTFLSVVWLKTALWTLSVYHIDVGDLYYYWLVSPNPVACWLAYGPLPFFAALGFIAFYTFTGRERSKGLRYFIYLAAGFGLWLVVVGVMALQNQSLSSGDTLMFGYLLSSLIIIFEAVWVLFKGRHNISKVQRRADLAEKNFFAIILAGVLMFGLSLAWSIGIERLTIFLMSGHYGVVASYELLSQDPALRWLETGFNLFFILFALFITLAVIFRKTPEYRRTIDILLNISFNAFIGCLMWLGFCIVLSLLQLKLNSNISDSAGTLFLAAILFYISDYAMFFKSSGPDYPSEVKADKKVYDV